MPTMRRRGAAHFSLTHFSLSLCAAEVVVGLDQARETAHEDVALGARQCGDGAVVRAADQRRDAPEEPAPRRREVAQLGAAVGLARDALDQFALLQPAQDVGAVGAVDADLARERHLVDGRVALERGEHAELHRRDVERRALLGEERDVDLVQAPDQEARPVGQRQFRRPAPRCGLARHAVPSLMRANRWRSPVATRYSA